VPVPAAVGPAPTAAPTAQSHSVTIASRHRQGAPHRRVNQRTDRPAGRHRHSTPG
jgi:hypothetical protein